MRDEPRKEVRNSSRKKANSSSRNSSKLSILVSTSMPRRPQRLWNAQIPSCGPAWSSSRALVRGARSGHRGSATTSACRRPPTVSGKRSPASRRSCLVWNGVLSAKVRFPGLFRLERLSSRAKCGAANLAKCQRTRKPMKMGTFGILGYKSKNWYFLFLIWVTRQKEETRHFPREIAGFRCFWVTDFEL